MAASYKDILRKVGITHIINMSGSEGFPNKFPSCFRYMKVNISDDQDSKISTKFQECFAFINKALSKNYANKVLIHCHAGHSRSPTIAIAYLMYSKNLPF